MMGFRNLAERSLAALGAVALVALSACAAGDTRLGPTDIAIAYERQEAAFAGSAGDFRVRLLGAPEDATFAARMLEAVEAGYVGPPTNFTYDPQNEVEGNYRIVLAFGEAGAIEPRGLCRRAMGEDEARRLPRGATGTGTGTGAEAGTSEADLSRLHAAFCRGTTYLTAVRGSLPPEVRPEDPAVDQTVAAAVRQLFPFRNPNRMDGPDLVSMLRSE